MITQSCPLNYTHDISDQVNFTEGDYVISANLELDFTNDLTDGHASVCGFTLYDFRENARYGFDGSSWTTIGEVDNGQYEIVVDVNLLNYDGQLAVALGVYNTNGTATAWLDHSRLYGTAQTAPVPEPATMLLLGFGLLGIAGVSRKK